MWLLHLALIGSSSHWILFDLRTELFQRREKCEVSELESDSPPVAKLPTFYFQQPTLMQQAKTDPARMSQMCFH